METKGDRLKREREAAGLTQDDLAKLVGKSKQAISNIEHGKTQEPEASTMAPILKRLNLTHQWFETGRGPKHPTTTDNEWDDIRGYALAAGLGNGIEAQEYAETHALKFRAASLARKRLDANALAVIYGKGDSMLPRIRTGDAILFDTSDTKPADEALFVIHCAGANNSEYSVKRCRQFGDDIYFDSLNPDGDHAWRKPRKMMDRKSPITIAGRVRWIGSWED